MRQGRSTGSTAAGIVLLVLLAGFGLFAVVVYRGLQTREVGPDADEMAQDPVLHLRFEGTTPHEIIASTGHEGGVAPALADSTSYAFRSWLADNDEDWVELLRSAVIAAGSEGVRWSNLSCYDGQFVFHGRKQVEVDDDLVASAVEVRISDIGSPTEPLRLTIRLASDGVGPPVPAEPTVESFLPNDEPCPPTLVALLAPSSQ